MTWGTRDSRMRDAALRMIQPREGTKRITVGGDKNYDTREWVGKLRKINVTPHVAQNRERRGGSAIDERTTRHLGYAISQQKRKRIEQSFGGMKIIGTLKKVKLRGREKVSWLFTFVGSAYNLYRLGRLEAEAVPWRAGLCEAVRPPSDRFPHATAAGAPARSTAARRPHTAWQTWRHLRQHGVHHLPDATQGVLNWHPLLRREIN